jgi:hypothetical protein
MKNYILSLLFIGCIASDNSYGQANRCASYGSSSYQTTSPSREISNGSSSYTPPSTNTVSYQPPAQDVSYKSYNTVEYARPAYSNTNDDKYAFGGSAPGPAGGSPSAFSNPGNAYMLTGGGFTGTRYNHVVNHHYPYFSSLSTKYKSKTHYKDNCGIRPRRLPFEFYYGEVCRNNYYSDAYLIDYFYDDYLTYADISDVTNTAEFVSLDGYLVYDKDTSAGIITMNNNSVSLEQPAGNNREYGSTAFFNDPYLKGVTLYKGNRTLYLARLSDKERQLWRVVHNGKMKVYDDTYSFLAFGNINYAGMRVRLPGERTYVDINSKKHLIWCMNKVYGLDLKAKDQTWQSLIQIIDNLD